MKYDMEVWQQAVTQMQDANKVMRERINSKPKGYVIVSNTFDHCVGCDDKRYATAEVIAFSTQPVVLQRNNAERLARTFKAYCVSDEQRTEFFAMIDRNVDRAKWNWAEHELADQVDFFCEKVTLLADACGVTKHKV